MPQNDRSTIQVGTSLADQVVHYVVEATASGALTIGELYSVYQLAEQLGISRSPVREGLLRLEEAGMVRFSRNRGFEIVPVTAEDVAEIFAIRLAVEVPGAARAASQMTDAFTTQLGELMQNMEELAAREEPEAFMEQDRLLHDLILEHSQSRRGRDSVNRLRVTTRLLGVSTVGTQRSLQQIHSEHEPLCDAIRDGDARAAAEAMRMHLTTTGLLLVTQTLGMHSQDAPREVEQRAAAIWQDYIDTPPTHFPPNQQRSAPPDTPQAHF